MEGKIINVYYKGVKQSFKVFDNSEEKDFLNLVKKVFHLESNISKIFLQDAEGNFLLLPKIIPDGLKAHLYIEPEYEQKTDNIKPDNSLLPGFKWDNNISLYDGKAVVSNDGYVLGKEGQLSGWTPVASSTIYSSGKLFFKMNIKFHYYQTLGVCSLNYDGKNYIGTMLMSRDLIFKIILLNIWKMDLFIQLLFFLI